LESVPDIKPKGASILLKIPYSHSFRNIFYYAKKCQNNTKSNLKTDTETMGGLSTSPLNNQDITGIIERPNQQETVLDKSTTPKSLNMVELIESNLNRILKVGTNDARILNTAISFSDKTSKFIIQEGSENKGN